MRKLLTVILCCTMVLSIASCSTSDTGSGSSSGRISAGKDSKTDSDVSEITEISGENGAGTAANGKENVSDPDGSFEPDFFFETTDRDGNTWNEQDLSANKLTMINFWEPWCGPCVREIPDLERLYENYKDQGFMILGVYQEPGMENEVVEILSDGGVTYPILHYTDEFARFQTGYVPTTVFVDGEGHIITMSDGTGSVIGSNSYSAWEAIINKYL